MNSVKNKQLDKIISEVATAHATAMVSEFAKGRRGVMPVREEGTEGNMVVSNGVVDQILNSKNN